MKMLFQISAAGTAMSNTIHVAKFEDVKPNFNVQHQEFMMIVSVQQLQLRILSYWSDTLKLHSE